MWVAADGTVVTIRPIRAEDLALEQEFVNGLSAHTGYQRLMSARRPSLEELVRFTDIDHERELAIVLSDDWQARGLGTKLLMSLVVAARSHGVRRLVGMTLSENRGMLALGRKLGFVRATDPRSATITNLTLDLAGGDTRQMTRPDDPATQA